MLSNSDRRTGTCLYAETRRVLFVCWVINGYWWADGFHSVWLVKPHWYPINLPFISSYSTRRNLASSARDKWPWSDAAVPLSSRQSRTPPSDRQGQKRLYKSLVGLANLWHANWGAIANLKGNSECRWPTYILNNSRNPQKKWIRSLSSKGNSVVEFLKGVHDLFCHADHPTTWIQGLQPINIYIYICI